MRSSIYAGTVMLEKGEIVRVAGSARIQRPHITPSSLPGRFSRSSRICSIVLARSKLVCSKAPCLFSRVPESASASGKSQSGHFDGTKSTSHTRAVWSFEAVTMRCGRRRENPENRRFENPAGMMA